MERLKERYGITFSPNNCWYTSHEYSISLLALLLFNVQKVSTQAKMVWGLHKNDGSTLFQIAAHNDVITGILSCFDYRVKNFGQISAWCAFLIQT